MRRFGPPGWDSAARRSRNLRLRRCAHRRSPRGWVSTGWWFAANLYDRERRLSKLLRLIRQQIAHALRAGPFGVVVVHPAHRPRGSCAPRAAHRRPCAACDRTRPPARRRSRPSPAIPSPGNRPVAFHLRRRNRATLVSCGTKRNPSRSSTNCLQRAAALWMVTRPRVLRAAGAHIEGAGRGGLRKNLLAIVKNVVDRCLDRRRGSFCPRTATMGNSFALAFDAAPEGRGGVWET